MNEMNELQTCKNCSYWKGDGILGECRYSAPDNSWPQTLPDDWCGDFSWPVGVSCVEFDNIGGACVKPRD